MLFAFDGSTWRYRPVRALINAHSAQTVVTVQHDDGEIREVPVSYLWSPESPIGRVAFELALRPRTAWTDALLSGGAR